MITTARPVAGVSVWPGRFRLCEREPDQDAGLQRHVSGQVDAHTIRIQTPSHRRSALSLVLTRMRFASLGVAVKRHVNGMPNTGTTSGSP